jgi:hypothetical protein
MKELLEAVTVYPDHLEVAVHGAPTINVLLGEVGLVDQSDFARVGGGTCGLKQRRRSRALSVSSSEG